MNYEQFTIKMQDALQSASAIAQQNDNGEIGLEHMLVALVEQKDGMTRPLVERVGADAGAILSSARDMLGSYPKVSGNIQAVNIIAFCQDTLCIVPFISRKND